MLRTALLTPLAWLLAAGLALADARMSVLVDVLQLSKAAAILSQEGQLQAGELDKDMLNGQGGPGWAAQVARIYAPDRMIEEVRAALTTELQGQQLEEVIAFYADDRGTRIIELENAARQAIQDPEVEEAARARFAALEGGDDPRLAVIAQFVDSGDMISRNVTSALNSNYQFLRGLVDGGAFEMSQEDILKDAAEDIEGATRDTTEWLFGYLLLAYSPLSDADLDAYLAFSRTPAGEALNRALFAGFGRAYEDISYALGRAVALNLTAQDL